MHPESSVMMEILLAELEGSLYITPLSICCKYVYVFLKEDLSLVDERNSPTSSLVEYHMTKKNRRLVIDQVVNFGNGCTK